VEPTCAALLVTAVDRYARTRGVALGVEELHALAPETQVPLPLYYDALERLAERLDEPLVGVEIAFAMGERGLGALSFMMVTASTAGEAIAAIFAHQALLSPAERYTRTIERDRVRLSYRPHGPSRPAHASSAQLFVADVVLNTPPEVDGAITGLEVAVRGPAPHREALGRRLGVPVVEAIEGEAEVRFDAAVLDLPMRRADPAMHAFFADYVAARVPSDDDDVVARLVPLIDARLAAGELRAAPLARALGVSTRTLQRRLRDAELTLRRLAAQRRLRRARALLHAGRSPSEAAHAAGYAEASSLHRALRRAKEGA
jgi:AraC-like DNA-binding protein